MQAHAYLACAPQGAGVSVALFYAACGHDICGWFAHEHVHRCAAAFFAVEDYYTAAGTHFCRSVDDDVHGPWIEQSAPVTTEIRCPIGEDDCLELSRLSSAYIREWLFFADEPRDHDEAALYRSLGLPVRPVNVRAAQFHCFDRNRPVWVHASPGIDLNVVLFLKKRLPASHREARFVA